MELIGICRLDRPKLTVFRRGVLELFRALVNRRDREAAALRRRFFGFPANLPELAALRPPEGNGRPQGIENSHFERRRRGEFPAVY
jgi:hypothetical protein